MYIAHSFLGTTPLLEALGIGSMVSGHIYPRYIDGVESQVELPNGGEGGGSHLNIALILVHLFATHFYMPFVQYRWWAVYSPAEHV